MLSAVYSGNSTYVTSTGTANVYIQNHSGNTGTTYCNTGVLSSNGSSGTNYFNTVPYPSVIFVGDGVNTDITNSVATVSFTAKNLSSTGPNGLKMLLVSPDNSHTLDFWSDAGASTAAGTGTYIIQDGASQLPSGGTLNPGTYAPTAYAGSMPDVFTPGPPTPAPQVPATFSSAAPAGDPNSKTFSTAFVGATAHGAWSLFVYDNSGATTSFGGGWCLDITPGTGHPTTTTLMSNPLLATEGASTSFTGTVSVTPPVTPVGNTGTVTFTENGAPLTGAPNGGVASVSTNVATIATTALPEGDHIVNGEYQDSTNTYSPSTGSVTMRVDKATTVSGSGTNFSYCNTGPVTIPAGSLAVNDSGPASPNPSNIFVTNLFGTINTVSLTLNGFKLMDGGSILESLLVGPGAANDNTLDFFSLIGNNIGFGPQNMTFSDASASALSCSTTGAPAAGTFKPTSCGATTYSASPFYTLPGTVQHAAPFGSSTFANVYANSVPDGTWSLYFDQTANTSGSGVNSGWCANFVENPPVLTATKGPSGLQVVQGDTGDSVTVVVHNPSGPGSAGGVAPVMVSDTFPSGRDCPLNRRK